jgi:hypothetical protein
MGSYLVIIKRDSEINNDIHLLIINYGSGVVGVLGCPSILPE